MVVAEILRQVDSISDARRERLVMADGVVPDIIWVVLFGGAALTIGFTFFFGTENLRAQALMTGVLSILIFAGLLTIIAIDHPFAGTVKVGPEALSQVVRDFAELPRNDSRTRRCTRRSYVTAASPSPCRSPWPYPSARHICRARRR